ncbi:MAG: hypothetical protein F4Y84_11710 [Caldilineaceae bacterium SB0665_bin_25]|nr:hypothetical protein [Caldilineaceae bacterium SB0665_bin_25]
MQARRLCFQEEEDVLLRRTQTASFWRDQFRVTDEDLDFTHELILDAESPMTTDQLALQLIREYQRRETARMESELKKGAVYQPKNLYDVGETLIFPAMDFLVGEVLETRAGQNPEHGAFDVIRVGFADTGETREFATNLQTGHRLNGANGQTTADEEALLSAEEIHSLYRNEIEESLLFTLQEGERNEDFVHIDDYWLLADMLAEVHVGHLNIAEALLEMQNRPMTPEELLPELDLQADDVSPPMQVISVNHALGSDERFDQVGSAAGPVWFLSRLEPPEAQTIPPLLQPKIGRYNRAILSVELLQMEWELDDEWGDSGATPVASVVPSISFTLTFPHWLYGTLPLSSRTRALFPHSAQERSMVTVVDGRWGNRYTAWVVHEGRYVCGLKDWMVAHNLPVSAQITLERTDEPDELIIDFRPRRMRREWSRIAKVDADRQRFALEMNKVQISCEYDENLIVSSEDREGLEAFNAGFEGNDAALEQIVEMIVPEIAKLNPQGTAHVKTIYSAVNMFWRCPPGPIFYTLISNSRFQDVGDGFFKVR